MKRDFFLDTLAKHVPSEYVTTIPAGGGMFQCELPKSRRLRSDR